ncbi:aminotransferase class III-fold pyridoxal phosphate-dependent enzyme [Planctomicrobium sp. SH527]|uniref:aminotransferase class III-fold pyridoxal phosphate-dependent enzyme n=1 Tax=Planctomicrobium sp. SH527 TaxID=3448123 RepID=UPI003F5C9EC1
MSQDQLVAEQFLSDPRIHQAQALLHAALADHQAQITGPRPPTGSRRATYAALVKEFESLRGGTLFFPYLGSGFGHGALVELADGSVKYDMISGIGVHSFGHNNPHLLDAGFFAALQDTVMQGNLQQSDQSVLFCRELIKLASETNAPIQHCFLSTSGATANENALKILFQARAPANRMLAFTNCFSGRTLATSQLTDRAKNRVGLPTVMNVDYVPYFDRNEAYSSTKHSIARLKEHLERYPNLHAGMILELIQGEGGYYTAPEEFLEAICQTLRSHNIPIWFDEIQTFGRTTRTFAFQHFELDQYADVVTVGKLTQVCATLFRDELTPKPGLISQTFTGATASIQAGLTILKLLQTGNYLGCDGKVARLHNRFAEHFHILHHKFPDRFHGPWGLGGMLAFSVHDGSEEKSKRFLLDLYEAGVIAFLAGAKPTRIRMLPPFGTINEHQVDEVCCIIESVLQLT